LADAPDKPVYLLTGSDRPKIETALKRLRGHFVPEAIDIANALDISGESAVALCNAGSLFGDAKLVVVEDIDGRPDSDQRRKGGWKSADVEAVGAYLRNPAPDTVLALVGEDVKKTTALWKACAKAGTILEFAVAKKGLQGWVTEQFRQRGVQAEPEASAALVQLVGDDLRALQTEVDKLATWAAGEPVGEREVLILAAPFGEEPLYALTDALGTRNGSSAIALSEAIFEKDDRKRRDVSARMAGAIASHITRLAALKRLSGRGVSSKEAAADLGMHPFRAQKLYEQAEGFSADELYDAVVRLAQLDGSLKGRSRLAPDLEVQRALVDLTRRPGTGRAS
jgi:DNA polymerase III subunit delta